MKSIKISFFALLMAGMLSSCYEDKGNYSYSDLGKITITLPENVSVMSGAEAVIFTPEITSETGQKLTADNANYEYSCRIHYYHRDPATGQYINWLDINPEKKMDINFFADIPAGSYELVYTVKNKETGIETNSISKITVLSSTFSGWMVLSNSVSDNEAQLDMISSNSSGEMVHVKNVLGPDAPKVYNGTQICMNPSKYSNAESVYMMTKTTSFRLDPENLTATAQSDMKLSDFIIPTVPGAPVNMTIVNGGGSYGPTSQVCITDLGNAYAITSGMSGACFEDPINTDKQGNDPTFKVAPIAGTSMARPGNSRGALFYDITNKRFVGWDYDAADNKVISAIPDPESSAKKFSYTTGMDFVTMKSTRFSDGMVYTVLQDAQNKRHIYGINMAGVKFAQEALYENLNAENFDNANDYAFHSQFPFMYYSYGNKVYGYNLGTKTAMDVLNLPAGETVTMVKFNLFVNMNLAELSDSSDEFLSQQFDLIVGSTTGQEEGGVVRFYKIGLDGKMTLKSEYKGFGNIVDVTYRERR